MECPPGDAESAVATPGTRGDRQFRRSVWFDAPLNTTPLQIGYIQHCPSRGQGPRMASTTNVTSALYYPYLDLHDYRWLNVAALYYDHLWRIVPPKWSVWDHGDVRKYVDAGFLRERSPHLAAGEVANEFESFLAETLDTPEKKVRLANDLRLSRGIRRLSVGKMIYSLALELKKKGLLTEDGADWYAIEALTGALYMLFLAKRLAGPLPLVSDDPAFQQLVYGTPAVDSSKDGHGGGRTYRLASLVLKTVIPDNIATIPVDTILKVREVTQEERVVFHDAISSLGSDLETIRDPRDAEDAIQHRQIAVSRSLKSFRAKLRGQQIACVTGLMGLSIPSVATAKWGFDVTSPVVLGSLGVVAAATFIAKTITDRKSAKLESHWSYLHTLRGKLKDFSAKEDVIGLHLN
jgi:hypothetical protein